MRQKPLSELLEKAEIAEIFGTIDWHHVTSHLCSDSRQVKLGSIFFAIPGLHVDGHNYLNGVAELGAYCAVVETINAGINLPQIKVKNSRRILSICAKRFYDHPSDELCMIGVTGTDGKSSTVFFIFQLLRLLGIKAGFFSTVAYQTGTSLEPNSFRQSTLEALELEEILRKMVDEGTTHAVIETTSHGLSHRTSRLIDIEFDFAAFTNISHEHLEFHGTFEQYAHDKSNLFAQMRTSRHRGSCAVINRADSQCDFMASRTLAPVLTYYSSARGNPLHSGTASDVWANEILTHAKGISFVLNTQTAKALCEIALAGVFNVENILAALVIASRVAEKSIFDLVPFLPKIQSVKGRMVIVDEGQPFGVIVDYAHTPGAFEQVLPSLRASTSKKLILVFGSAGERDVQKRPIQGGLAAKYGDVLVITSEDPRLEDPRIIMDDIIKGAIDQNPTIQIYAEPDRPLAVELAIALARQGDLVAFLGKGHEQSIVYPDGKRPYDEESCARIALKKLLKKESK